MLTTMRRTGIIDSFFICVLLSDSVVIPVNSRKSQERRIIKKIKGFSLVKKGITIKLLIHNSRNILVRPLSSFQKCLGSLLTESFAISKESVF